MRIEISKVELLSLLNRQLNSCFGLSAEQKCILEQYIDPVLDRLKKCFELNTNKYYSQDGQVYFNPFHSVQYMIFLYYFANSIYRNRPSESILCDKLYYLNKMLNSVDLFYSVELPDFFMAEHPVGAVIGGKGLIGSGFLFYQGCTLGGFHESNGEISYPNLGQNVRMYAHSGIIGNCTIGDNVNIGAGAFIKNQNIPACSTVFGQSPNLIIKSKIII